MAEINPESGATQDGSFLDVTNSLYDEEPLCEAGEPCYVGELEDVLSGDALLELHLEERADHFLITADDAYDIYRKDQDWLEMAANLWRAMRELDAGGWRSGAGVVPGQSRRGAGPLR